MQLQMEVCNLDVCNFLECVVKHYDTREEYEKDVFENGKTKKERVTHTSNGMEKGVMMEGISPSTNTFFYRYSPLGIMPNKIDAWLAKSEESIKKEAIKEGFNDVKIRRFIGMRRNTLVFVFIKIVIGLQIILQNSTDFGERLNIIEKMELKKLEEFVNTGKSDCLPKHPGIIDFLDMKIRKSKNTKTANLFKNKCVIDVSDDDTDNNSKIPKNRK